jgi:hypothetical protein
MTNEQFKTIESAVVLVLLDGDGRSIAQLEADLAQHPSLVVREAVGALEHEGVVEHAECALSVTRPVRYLDVLGVIAI